MKLKYFSQGSHLGMHKADVRTQVSLNVNTIVLPDLLGFTWTANILGVLMFLITFKKTDLLRDSGRQCSYLRGPAGQAGVGGPI